MGFARAFAAAVVTVSLCCSSAGTGRVEVDVIWLQRNQPVTRIRGVLHGIRDEVVYGFAAGAGDHVRATVTAEGPTRGEVISPSGRVEGGPGGTFFADTLSETGEYRIRVKESEMGEEWHGMFTLEVEIRKPADPPQSL